MLVRGFIVLVALVAGCLSMPPRPDPGGPPVDARGSGSGFDGSVNSPADLATDLAEGALMAVASGAPPSS